MFSLIHYKGRLPWEKISVGGGNIKSGERHWFSYGDIFFHAKNIIIVWSCIHRQTPPQPPMHFPHFLNLYHHSLPISSLYLVFFCSPSLHHPDFYLSVQLLWGPESSSSSSHSSSSPGQSKQSQDHILQVRFAVMSLLCETGIFKHY